MVRFIRLTVFVLVWVAAGGAALAAETVQRPLVVVAGILGSKLCNRSGDVVWGTGSSLKNFARLELGASSQEDLASCGLIEKVEVFGPLYSIKAYAGLLAYLKSIGFNESNLYLFDYDWRQSNFETAKKLKTFIEERQKDGRLPGKFDILAHSMGGIVTRIYLDENPGSAVNKVIYFGTPFLGSANTLGTLSEGWGSFSNWLAGGIDTIRRVAMSFPGFMELLPRYDKCCYVRLTSGPAEAIDIFDAEKWRALNWLPDGLKTDPERFAAFKKTLVRSKSLNDLLRSAPPNVAEIIFAGDGHSTNVYFGVKEGATAPDPSRWYFSKDLGDGTVPVWSAARKPAFDNLAGTIVSFAEHSTLFDDNWAEDELKRELLSITPVTREPIKGRGHPVISVLIGGNQLNWTIKSMDLSAEQPTYLLKETLRAKATIYVDGPTETLRTGLVNPVAVLRSDSRRDTVAIVETTNAADLSRGQLTFAVTSELNSQQAGSLELEFSLPTVRDDAKSVFRFAIIGD
jgi:pimeloyl-ACP methyl ester carboxylesterase